MSDIETALFTETNDPSVEYAETVVQIASELLHKVLNKQDYHAEALMLADHAHQLAECAEGEHDCSYEHVEADTSPDSTLLSSETKEVQQLPEEHKFVMLRSDQLTGEYTSRGYRTFTSFCESFESVEEAYAAVKGDQLRPLYVAEMKNDGECSVIYVVTKQSDSDHNNPALI